VVFKVSLIGRVTRGVVCGLKELNLSYSQYGDYILTHLEARLISLAVRDGLSGFLMFLFIREIYLLNLSLINNPINCTNIQIYTDDYDIVMNHDENPAMMLPPMNFWAAYAPY
jgi:hypothetical protein